MDDDTRFIVEFVAAQAVFVAALIHLTLGVINWLRYVRAGLFVPQDVRWPVFVVSGAALVAGLYVASHRDRRRRFYAAGVAVMLGYAVGYFAWHLGGHPTLFGPAGVTETVSVQWFLDHLLAGPVEFASIVAESVAAALLSVLWLTDS